MKFLDRVKIYVRSGHGGDGAVAFRRERFLPFGGPDGGDGGKGGDIVFRAEDSLNTLIDFRYTQHFKAKSGENGAGADRTGKSAPDLVIPVPTGTEILAADGEAILADLDRAGAEVRLLRGGDGGFGNTHFKSSTNQTPRRATKGFPGEERWLWLRLKLIADAALVGLPNAGKSTLLAALSAAHPKIAEYPFTTLQPILGVVEPARGESFVLADLPGLIARAHAGAGLGTRFLRHVERARVLVHVVDGAAPGCVAAWRTIRGELAAYGAGLAEKPEIIVLAKGDLLTPRQIAARRSALERASGERVCVISAEHARGLDDLTQAIAAMLLPRQ